MDQNTGKNSELLQTNNAKKTKSKGKVNVEQPVNFADQEGKILQSQEDLRKAKESLDNKDKMKTHSIFSNTNHFNTELDQIKQESETKNQYEQRAQKLQAIKEKDTILRKPEDRSFDGFPIFSEFKETAPEQLKIKPESRIKQQDQSKSLSRIEILDREQNSLKNQSQLKNNSIFSETPEKNTSKSKVVKEISGGQIEVLEEKKDIVSQKKNAQKINPEASLFKNDGGKVEEHKKKLLSKTKKQDEPSVKISEPQTGAVEEKQDALNNEDQVIKPNERLSPLKEIKLKKSQITQTSETIEQEDQKIFQPLVEIEEDQQSAIEAGNQKQLDDIDNQLPSLNYEDVIKTSQFDNIRSPIKQAKQKLSLMKSSSKTKEQTNEEMPTKQHMVQSKQYILEAPELPIEKESPYKNQTSTLFDEEDIVVKPTPARKAIFSKNDGQPTIKRELLKKAKKYQQEKLSKKADAKEIKNIENLEEVGIIAFQKGDYNKALTYFDDAKERCKNSNLDTTKLEQSISYFQASTLLRTARAQDAQRIIQEQDDSVYNLLPRMLHRNKIEDAKNNGFKDIELTDIQNATLIYKHACAKLNSASEYESIIKGAISDFQKASYLNPDLKGPSLEKIGDCFVILGLYQLALNVYNQSLDITSLQVNHISSSNPSQIKLKIAKCLEKLNKPDEAITKYDELIETDPNTISHYLNKAKLLMSKDIKSAIETCKKAIGLNPQSHTALNLLSNMYNEDGNYKKALESSKSSLKIKETEEGYAQYARSFAKLGNTKDAIENIIKALGINPNNSALLILKAEIYLKKAKEIFNSKEADDYSQALEAFTQANEINETLYSSLEIIKLLKYSQNKEGINENLLKYLNKIEKILSCTKPTKENTELKNCIFSTKQLYEIKSKIDSHLNEVNQSQLKEIPTQDKKYIDNLDEKIFKILSTIDSRELSIDKNALKKINEYLIKFIHIKNELEIDSEDLPELSQKQLVETKVIEDKKFIKSKSMPQGKEYKERKDELQTHSRSYLEQEKETKYESHTSKSTTQCLGFTIKKENNQSISDSFKSNFRQEQEGIVKSTSTPKCSGPNPKDCTIFVQTETRYDNELLNHPDLLSYCSKILGIKSVMELSQNLSNELIHESLETNDYDVAVAGLMSLQPE